MTRLQRYRAFLAAMNPSSDPQVAIDDGLYVEPPGQPVWAALKLKLELEPASTHLVLGGIGSGKTSELLKARLELQKSLTEVGDFVAYCDVSQHHHLDAKPVRGALFALAARQLMQVGSVPTKGPVADAKRALQRFSAGYERVVDPYEPDEDHEPDEDPLDYEQIEYVPGVLEPPPQTELVPWPLNNLIPNLRMLRDHVLGEDKSAVMCFDSLDRLARPESFKTMVVDDVRALKHAGIGVVVAGPIRYSVGSDRSLVDIFDHTYFNLAVDPEQPSGLEFLCEVLRKRSAASGLLPDGILAPLAQASGGALRDLITLAKRSAEEAYAAGHPTVEIEDVERAAEAMGRSLAVGLDDAQLKLLRNVESTGGFVVRGERELSLLETRRVLLYPGNHWAVHPTLAPLLDLMPEVD